MSPPITVTSFVLTQIWTETLKQSPPPQLAQQTPLGMLSHDTTYQATFSHLQQNPPAEMAPLRLPWQIPGVHPRKQFFWLRYAGLKKSLYDLEPKQAWKMLIPLVLNDHTGSSPDGHQPAVALRAQGFVYPYGFSLVLTARVDAPLDLLAAIDLAQEIRSTHAFTLLHGSEARHGLGEVAEHCLGTLRTLAGGAPAPPSDLFDFFAFTLFSILDAHGISAETQIQPGDTLHHGLYGVTGWKKTYTTDPLLSFNDLVSSHPHNDLTAPLQPANLLVGTSRSRAYLSAPHLAAHNSKSLQYYHDNLALLSMQTESLSGLVQEIAKGIGAGASLDAMQEHLAEKATLILSRLYGGAPDIYRAWSARMQLQQNNVLPALNMLRQRYGRKPLA